MTNEIEKQVDDVVNTLKQHVDRVLELQELIELSVGAYDSTSSELTEDFDSEYRRQTITQSSDGDMGFGQMVGLLGRTYLDGRSTIDEARRPMTLRVLNLAKNLVDGFTEECGYLIDGLVDLYYKSYDEINLFSERARRSMLHHSTQVATTIRQMARDQFGEFMPLDTLDGYIGPFVSEMEDYVSN